MPVYRCMITFCLCFVLVSDHVAGDPWQEESTGSLSVETGSAVMASIGDDGNLTPGEQTRKKMLEHCLAVYYTRYVDADVLRPWSIMHGLIAYGNETQITIGGRRVNAAEYLCANGIGDDRRILFVEDGQLRTRVGPGVQGHEGQLLAMLAQSGIPEEQPIVVDGHSFTVRDLIEYEQKGCRSHHELTFQLIGLSHYLDSDSTWTNRAGEPWSISRMVSEELSEEVNEGACGGTHRLMSLSCAVEKRRLEGKPIENNWWRAEKFVREFQEYALQFQHRNGCFSTQWFRGREFDRDANLRLYSTGHILEWLVYSLPKERLREPEITRAVDYLLNLMLGAPDFELPVGPRGHALHALKMYEDKVFGNSDHTRYVNDAPATQGNRQRVPSRSAGFHSNGTQRDTPPPIRRRRIFGRNR